MYRMCSCVVCMSFGFHGALVQKFIYSQWFENFICMSLFFGSIRVMFLCVVVVELSFFCFVFIQVKWTWSKQRNCTNFRYLHLALFACTSPLSPTLSLTERQKKYYYFFSLLRPCFVHFIFIDPLKLTDVQRKVKWIYFFVLCVCFHFFCVYFIVR